MVDVVRIEPRSIPSSAMVCAIAGEIPEMIVDSDLNRNNIVDPNDMAIISTN